MQQQSTAIFRRYKAAQFCWFVQLYICGEMRKLVLSFHLNFPAICKFGRFIGCIGNKFFAENRRLLLSVVFCYLVVLCFQILWHQELGVSPAGVLYWLCFFA